MLITLSPGEMKRVEARAMAETGVTGEKLMERAAEHIARAVERYLAVKRGRVLCICGTGNNGGDGLAAMRLVGGQDANVPITVWLPEGKMSAEAELQKQRLKQERPWVSLMTAGEGSLLPTLPPDTACVVDALFGTGLSRKVTGTEAGLCQAMQEAYHSGIPVVAVDIPSGLHGDTGKIMGIAVHATETVTFHRPKTGLFLGDGLNLSGKVRVASIGIENRMDDAKGFWVAEERDVSAWFPPRPRACHKGTFGRVLVVAGKRGMAGAAAICATAALRAGAGMVRVACPEEIVDTVQQLCPCATCLPLRPGEEGARLLVEACRWADALALGPGLGTGLSARRWMERVLTELQRNGKPAVLDADALNILAMRREEMGAPEALRPCHILTPHPVEAARLLGAPKDAAQEDAPAAARALQACYGASIVLKGAASVLISGQEQGLNILGTPGMAKGGSGDALTGVLGALLANQSAGASDLSFFQVLQAGTALHGLAGRAAAKAYGERGMLATDLCAELGRVSVRSARKFRLPPRASLR